MRPEFLELHDNSGIGTHVAMVADSINHSHVFGKLMMALGCCDKVNPSEVYMIQ